MKSTLLKNLKTALFCAVTLFCLLVCACKTDLESISSTDKNTNNSVMGIEITLPVLRNRSAYYSLAEAKNFTITVKNESDLVAAVGGLPGEKVQIELPSAGTYTVTVKAFNKDNTLIGEGTATKEIKADDGIVQVTIILTAKEKSEMKVNLLFRDSRLPLDKGLEYLNYETKDDGTIVEKRTTIFNTFDDDDFVRRDSVVEFATDNTIKTKDVYNNGEVVFESTVDENGNTQVSGKYSDGTEIELKEISLLYVEGADVYNMPLPLSDFFTSNDLVEGDVIRVQFWGYYKDTFNNLSYHIASGAAEDNYYTPLSESHYEYSNQYSSFFIYDELEITKTSEADIQNFDFRLNSLRRSGEKIEDCYNNISSIKILGNIELSLEKDLSKRVKLTLDPNGGSVTETEYYAYPGKRLNIPLTPPLEKKFFGGWEDSEGHTVTTVPATNSSLTAKWSNTLDLVSTSIDHPWWPAWTCQHWKNQIEIYPDAKLVLTFTVNSDDCPWIGIVMDTEDGSYPSLVSWSGYINSTERNIVYKKDVSEILAEYPSLNSIVLSENFKNNAAVTLTGYYLEYPEN